MNTKFWMTRVTSHMGVGDADSRLDQPLQLFKSPELVRLSRNHRVQIELTCGPATFRRFCADVRFPASDRMVMIVMVMPMIVIAAGAMYVIVVMMIMVMVVMIVVVIMMVVVIVVMMVVATAGAVDMFVFRRMFVTLFRRMRAARAMNVP
jgi:hypothetical protein